MADFKSTGELNNSLKGVQSFLKSAVDRIHTGLTGVIDPALFASSEKLHIRAGFYSDRQRIKMNKYVFREKFSAAGHRVVIFLHGLCCHEDDWQTYKKDEKSYSELFEEHSDVTSLFVRYNTGLSLKENGRIISDLFEQLLEVYPVEMNEVFLVGHSQGGLIAQAGLIEAAQQSHTWHKKVKKVFLIGSPLSGSYLAKLAGFTSQVLGSIRNNTTQLISNILELRSPAIKDLAHGSGYSDEELQLLSEQIKFIKIGGILSDTEHGIVSRLIGDGLVRPSSVKGERVFSEKGENEDVHFIKKSGHLKILKDRRVFDILHGHISDEKKPVEQVP